jgi:hypothetical protein
MARNGKKPARSKQKSASLDNVAEYRHKEATRKNNPPTVWAALKQRAKTGNGSYVFPSQNTRIAP